MAPGAWAQLAGWSVGEPVTVPVGAGQGAALVEGRLAVYGDAETGVLRFIDRETLAPIGADLPLTRGGVDLLPHPTGLAHHPALGTFMGDTVRQRGVIYALDWPRIEAGSGVGEAVLNVCVDDLAVNGTRPEFVRVGERWVIASSDYGPERNAVRLYDPAMLRVAPRTSTPGVLIAETPCGPFVQTIEWVEDYDPEAPGSQSAILLVQNITPGLGYRLTAGRIADDGTISWDEPIDLDWPTDELEGLVVFPDDPTRGVAISASREGNVYPVRLEWE